MSYIDPFDGMPADAAAEFDAFERDAITELLPKLERSAVVCSLVPRGDADIKFAVELGLSIMLDKPIIAVAFPGRTVPDRLRRAADVVVELDFEPNTAEGQRELLQRLQPHLERLGKD